MESKDKKDTYSICMNEWLLDKEIKNELALLISIGSLTTINKEKYCYASNKYFAELFVENEVSISRKIKHLESKNYIKIRYKKCGNVVLNREIRLTKILPTINKNVNGAINKNVKDINNSNYINNNINNKENKKEKMKIASYPELKSAIKEDYLYRIASIYKLNKQTTLSLLDAFVNINKDKKSNEFKFCQHFENWLQTDKGQQAIDSTRISSNITNNYQQD